MREHNDIAELMDSNVPMPEPDYGITVREDVGRFLSFWRDHGQYHTRWLVYPSGQEREVLRTRAGQWEQRILSSGTELPQLELFRAVGQLVIQGEVLLEPMSHRLETTAEEILQAVDSQGGTIDGVIDREVEWNSVREAWCRVALALVTAARYRLDGDLFDQRVEALTPFVDVDRDVGHGTIHERCLWAIFRMDFSALAHLLADWRVEDSDPIWAVRKAAMLAESGCHDEATELVEGALETIRKSYGPDSVEGASREGWALWSTLTWDNHQDVRTRWAELASLKCDAWSEKDSISRGLRRADDTGESPLFDLGHRRGPSVRFVGNPSRLAEYRAIRLSEVVGLPPVTYHLGGIPSAVASDILKLAADELASYDVESAVRLILRVCNSENDATLMRVLARTRLATMSAETALRLAQVCIRVIEYARPRAVVEDGRRLGVLWVERMRVAMEVLSRLVLRITLDERERILDLALEYYRSEEVRQDHWLYRSTGNLLERSWRTLPKCRRVNRLLDLLDLPIVGMDGFTAAIEDHYPDPGFFLGPEDFAGERPPDDDGQWSRVIDLLVWGMAANGEARRRSSRRLFNLALGTTLTSDECAVFAEALWDEDHITDDGLPANTGFYDWAFLLLPAPSPELPEQRFRSKWLATTGTPSENATNAEEAFHQIGGAMSSLRSRGRSLTLRDEERDYLANLVAQWADSPIPKHTDVFFQMQMRRPIHDALSGLAAILIEMEIPERVGEQLYAKITQLTESGTPGFHALPGLVKTLPKRRDELAIWLRIGLGSDETTVAENAVTGLHVWLLASAGDGASVASPPDDLVSEVGIIIATRRSAALQLALQLARWVFDEGDQKHRNVLVHLAVRGLGHLAGELQYDSADGQPANSDVPLLRLLCAQLAWSMSQSGFGAGSAVTDWLEIAQRDPFPEVNYVVTPFHETSSP